MLRSSVHLFLLFVLVCLSYSHSYAAQSECNNGNGDHPCPTVASTTTQWGVSWRNYSQVGIVGKGIFGKPDTVLDIIEEAVPTLDAYFNGTNANKTVIQRTIPILVLQAPAGNQTAYLVCFFLPDAYLSHVPGFVNATGFLHINTWPTAAGAHFTPIVYSYLDRAHNHNIAHNTQLLQAQLKAHHVDYYTGLTGFVTYGWPHGDVQQNEVWVFAESPFPGHMLGHTAKPRAMVEQQ